ncbi:MAG TPA: hypothetical protein VEC58_10125, partial [Roseiarcus sp.]|nr:hypothetical protein [Roseiarcus sp.]
MAQSAKPAKSREELSAAIIARLHKFPEGREVTGVVLAPVPRRQAGHPNWHAAFTTGGGGA